MRNRNPLGSPQFMDAVSLWILACIAGLVALHIAFHEERYGFYPAAISAILFNVAVYFAAGGRIGRRRR